jgi:hypothetical protein
MNDPRLRPLPKICTACGTRCTADESPVCDCLESWKLELRCFWVFAAIVIFTVGVLPLLILAKGD